MNAWLSLYQWVYERAARPFLFRGSPQAAHERVIELLRAWDTHAWLQPILRAIYTRTFPDQPTQVGGVTLPHPIMLAAGFVKGDGFADEDSACAAVKAGRDMMAGWRTMPALVGAVEFGSFTRYPRMGNSGTVIWRDQKTQSTQNRIGLRNAGAKASAAFLANHPDQLPPIYGINLAVSPGINDPEQEQAELLEAAAFFSDAGIKPAWVTLNLSCPNTDDDPTGNQSEAKARRLCHALINVIDAPLWVKISPNLSEEQLHGLMHAFAECGVRAVIATNTRGEPTPDGQATAGVGGGRLYPHALETITRLNAIKHARGYDIDLIGCGGILDGSQLAAYHQAGAAGFQIWSALVYRGLLAGALILQEANKPKV